MRSARPVQSSSGSSGGGTDQFHSHDDAKDTFDTSNRQTVVLTSTAAAGAVTKITLNDYFTDDGSLDEHDDETDDETLPTPSSGENDDFTFDDSADEQDTAHDDGTIVVTVKGKVNASTYVDSTETLSLDDTETESDTEDDTGTEDDSLPAGQGPGSDSEQDTLTNKALVHGNLTIGDVLDSTQVVVNPDGSIQKSVIDSQNTDNITDDEQDTDSDQHTANVSPPSAGSGNSTPSPGGETDTDQDTLGIKSMLKDMAIGNATVTNTLWKPVANGVLSSVSKLIASGNDTLTDVYRDKATDNLSGPPVGQVSNLPVSDAETDNNADSLFDKYSGKIQEKDYTQLLLTDPATGVKTDLLLGDSVKDTFGGQAGDNTGDNSTANLSPPSQGGATGGSSGTDNFKDNFNASGNDSVTNNGQIILSVTGSPVAGQTVNLTEKLTLNGGDQSQSSVTGGDQEQSSFGTGSAPTDNVTGNETLRSGDNGNQTVAVSGNTTLSIVDPVTNLTTTDTLVDKGSVGLGLKTNDTVTDNHPQSAAGGGEDDLTNNDQLKESLAGGDKSTETLVVSGTSPDGMTINSTNTIGNSSQLSGTASDGDVGSESVGESNGSVTSDTEGDTETAGDDIKLQRKSTDKLQFHLSGTDPLTGLQDDIDVTDDSTDQETDEETDSSTNTEGISQNGTASASSADLKFDDKLTQGGQATDNLKIVIGVQGTDTQGETVNAQETILLNGNATDSVSDEDVGEEDAGIAGAPPSGDTEVVHADVQVHTGITDTITGTITKVDPTTGIKTTTTDNDVFTGTDDEHDHEDETDVRSPGQPDNDTATQNDASTLSIAWNDSENVTQTNPDGSVVGAPTNTTNSGNDTISSNVALTTGSDGTVTKTPTGSHTGSNISSDPSVGTTTWTGQALDQPTLDAFSASATPLSNVSTQGAGQGSNSGSSGSTGSSGGTGSVGSGNAPPIGGRILLEDVLGPESAKSAIGEEESSLRSQEELARKARIQKIIEELPPVEYTKYLVTVDGRAFDIGPELHARWVKAANLTGWSAASSGAIGFPESLEFVNAEITRRARLYFAEQDLYRGNISSWSAAVRNERAGQEMNLLHMDRINRASTAATLGIPVVRGGLSIAGRASLRLAAGRVASAEVLAPGVFARYGGAQQRQALLNRVAETSTLREAKGTVYAFREMERLGYRLEDVSLHYRGNQGVDLVFSQGQRYAVVEAKHGASLSLLKTYKFNLRQGSLDYNTSRLQRYLDFGDGTNDALVNLLLDKAAMGELDSFGAFYRGRSIFELPLGWPSIPAIGR
jgi:hypothetical protein